MSLHDRIMRLRTEPYIETLSDEARVAYKNGHKVARHYAAELSLEADELMAEMAQTLEELRDYDRNNKTEALCAYKSILEALGNYHHFKESTK